MRVSRASWHYRLANRAHHEQGGEGEYVPRDLCSYFWTVVGTLLVFVLLLAIGIGALAFLVKIIINHWAIVVVIVMGVGIGGGVWGITWRIGRAWRWLRPQKGGAQRKRPLGLVASYISAKKRKICPLIELEP